MGGFSNVLCELLWVEDTHATPQTPTKMSSKTIAPPCIRAEDKDAYSSKPFVDGRKFLLNGEVKAWDGPVQEVFAPIFESEAADKKVLIGYQVAPHRAAPRPYLPQ